jgi:hypothetical protein
VACTQLWHELYKRFKYVSQLSSASMPHKCYRPRVWVARPWLIELWARIYPALIIVDDGYSKVFSRFRALHILKTCQLMHVDVDKPISDSIPVGSLDQTLDSLPDKSLTAYTRHPGRCVVFYWKATHKSWSPRNLLALYFLVCHHNRRPFAESKLT